MTGAVYIALYATELVWLVMEEVVLIAWRVKAIAHFLGLNAYAIKVLSFK
jgi:hypothetical protein